MNNPPSPHADRSICPDPRPSNRYLDVWRRHRPGLGYPDQRHHFYANLQDEVERRPGRSLDGLLDDALKRTREAGKPDYPWRDLGESVEWLMSRSPVVVDENGDLIKPGWRTLSRPVAKLLPCWRERLDGTLIRVLVEQGQRIACTDRAALAGALLLRRDEEAKAFVLRAIDLLLEVGTLREGDDGRFIVPAGSS